MASLVDALKLPSLRAEKKPLPERGAEHRMLEREGEESKPSLASESGVRTARNHFFARLGRAVRTSSRLTIPLIGKLPVAKQVKVLSAIIALLLLATVLTFGLSIWDARTRREQALVATDLQLLALRLAHFAHSAAMGRGEAFGAMNEVRDRLQTRLNLLSDGGTAGGFDVPAPTEAEQTMLKGIAQIWLPIEEQVRKVRNQQNSLLQLREHEQVVEESAVRILRLSQTLLGGAINRGEDFRAAAWARQLHADVLNFELLDARALVSTDSPNPQVALQLAKNVGTFTNTLNGLLEGNPQAGVSPLQNGLNREIATELLSAITALKSGVDSIVRDMEGLAQAKQAARDLSTGAQRMVGKLEHLTEHYREIGTGSTGTAGGVFLSMLTLLGLALVAKVLIDDVRARATKTEAENRRNEEAILRLLDDMSDLAEGNLTRYARVTEDMTGAIADSVNYAIDELRSLVTQINTAAVQLTQSSTQGRAVSVHLLQVAEKQSHQIEEAASSVIEMASSMDAVSEDARKCAEVATQFLAASGHGGAAVQESIASMNNLREQIQETAKRIKHLGESSQEIGEIVQLIAGITEQTNVLALNAAIQAAAAGEAGRGFSVVAEEVQRLAERSGEATKQIATIVKAIQHDTQDVVAAMERSTNGVVRGAELADSAGRALDEIRDVSRRLADLVASISSATLAQRQLAKQMEQRMHDLLSVTTQSTKGSKWTADSMAQIAELANNLRVSVAGFKV